MTKITMPEPRWYAAMHGQALYGVFDTPEAAFEAVSDTPGLMTIDRLITTTQAQAYAAAKVREALEGAAKVALDAPITAGILDSNDAKAVSFHASSRILAMMLIPQQ